MLNDPLANVLGVILNGERSGKSECIVTPSSGMILRVLELLKGYGYVKDVSVASSARGGSLKISLSGNLNCCGVIKPRYSVGLVDFEKFEKRYLPAKNMGFLIISTPLGLMTHIDAMSKKTGGRLIAYCY